MASNVTCAEMPGCPLVRVMSRRQSRYALFLPVLWFMAVEFIDELVDGAFGAAWPAVKSDLHLSLTQIGLLLSLPRFLGNVVEVPLGILADMTPRRRLILAGGLAFVLATGLIMAAPNFPVLLAGLILFNPASGAFISISQATLMDMAPEQRELNMARWTLAGSLGNLIGPLAVGAAAAASLGWRPVFGLIAILALGAVVMQRFPMPASSLSEPAPAEVATAPPLSRIARDIRQAASGGALRWLVLLETSDLMLDIFRGYLALYFVEVLFVSQVTAGLAVAALTGASLAGGAFMVPLLNRISGQAWLRISALAVAVVFPAFLLIDAVLWKTVLAALLGFLTAGWYSVLKAGLYAAVPGRSGTAVALTNVAGLIGALIPFGLGLIADVFGLQLALWLLLVAPAALLIGLPRQRAAQPQRA